MKPSALSPVYAWARHRDDSRAIVWSYTMELKGSWFIYWEIRLWSEFQHMGLRRGQRGRGTTGVGRDAKGTDDPEDCQKEATPPSRRALFGRSRGFRIWRRGSYPSQGGSGIRMPDRGPVGWLLLEARKKKKGPHQFFVWWSFFEY
jgi:hypothetical protein